MDRTESPTIGFYHPRAGVRTGGGKSVYVRGMLRQLADDHDVVLYTGEGRLLEAVDELPIDVVQVPTERLAGEDEPDAAASAAPAAAPGRLVRAATAADVPSRVLERVVPSASAQTSLLAFANARRRGLCEAMGRRLDVLYTQYFLDDVLLSRAVDVPTVYHCHGLAGRGVGEYLRARLSATEHCLANTERIAAQLARRFGVAPDGVVAPGVDVDRFAPDATPAVESDAPVVLFVGRVERSKGVFELVDAVAGLSADATCHVVGDGPHEPALRAHVADRELEASVRFHGVVPHEELHRYYAAADVVCNPSHYESLGIANLEALACGRALVATRLAAVEAYVTHGESGLLVPPGDVDALRRALDRALDSPALRERLGRAGRDAALEYAWDEQGGRLARSLAEAAGATEAPAGEVGDADAAGEAGVNGDASADDGTERANARVSDDPATGRTAAHSEASSGPRHRADRR